MRAFIDRLSGKYQLSAGKPPSVAQQKLAQLRRDAAAAGLRDSDTESEARSSSGPGSERAPSALLWQQRPGSPAAAAADAARWGKPQAAASSPVTATGVAALAARLGAMEARLQQFEAAQGEVQSLRQQLSELQAQHTALHSGEGFLPVDGASATVADSLLSFSVTMRNPLLSGLPVQM